MSTKRSNVNYINHKKELHHGHHGPHSSPQETRAKRTKRSKKFVFIRETHADIRNVKFFGVRFIPFIN